MPQPFLYHQRINTQSSDSRGCFFTSFNRFLLKRVLPFKTPATSNNNHQWILNIQIEQDSCALERCQTSVLLVEIAAEGLARL